MVENTETEPLLQLERIAHTERDITLIMRSLKTFLHMQKAKHEPLVEKPLPSISSPPSDSAEDIRHYPAHPHEASSRSNASARHLKPATLNEFSGDRTKGRAFLNLCELYINLVPHQFVDDHAKIMWAFSFMKSDRAACFMD